MDNEASRKRKLETDEAETTEKKKSRVGEEEESSSSKEEDTRELPDELIKMILQIAGNEAQRNDGTTCTLLACRLVCSTWKKLAPPLPQQEKLRLTINDATAETSPLQREQYNQKLLKWCLSVYPSTYPPLLALAAADRDLETVKMLRERGCPISNSVWGPALRTWEKGGNQICAWLYEDNGFRKQDYRAGRKLIKAAKWSRSHMPSKRDLNDALEGGVGALAWLRTHGSKNIPLIRMLGAAVKRDKTNEAMWCINAIRDARKQKRPTDVDGVNKDNTMHLACVENGNLELFAELLTIFDFDMEAAYKLALQRERYSIAKFLLAHPYGLRTASAAKLNANLKRKTYSWNRSVRNQVCPWFS
jgi:hypothetical protein